jgi:4-carboxymuconolactone decarboxylase
MVCAQEAGAGGGLDAAIIDAINHRHVPDFDDPKAQLVYEFSEALHENHNVPKLLYEKAIELLGETGVVELVGLLGYYSLVSMTLNTFEVEVPEGDICDLVPDHPVHTSGEECRLNGETRYA